MKYWRLVATMLFWRKIQTIFTLVCVVIAFAMFGLLESVRGAFEVGGEGITNADRLITVSRIGLIVSLPKKLLPRIEALPGVEQVSFESWFGGNYRGSRVFFANEAIPDNFLDFHPEWRLPVDQRRAFRNTQMGAIAGEALARKFNWKLGESIPLAASGIVQKNGSNTWTFELVGIYRATDPSLEGQENELFFNWEYLNQARQTGSDSVDWYVVKVANHCRADQVAKAIDALSVNSDHETLTLSAQSVDARHFAQFGAIGPIVNSIIGAVFLTLVILVGNSMAQAVRERIRELAVLRLLGFPNATVITFLIVESLFLVVLGAWAGLILSDIVVIGVRMAGGIDLPMLPIPGSAWLLGTGLALAIGLIVGGFPAIRGVREPMVGAA